MNVLGAILLILGLIGAIAVYFARQPGTMLYDIITEGYVPGFLVNAGLSSAMWLGVAAIGGAMLYLNRRPSD